MSSAITFSASGEFDRPENIAPSPPFSEPKLDALVPHLVAAKRSLSVSSNVWRAKEIVTTARDSLETSVIVSARTRFVRRGLSDQIQLLFKVRGEVGEVAESGRTEFAASIKELDTVNEQLQHTLGVLRGTAVEPAFHQEEESCKTLHDFVDERAVEDIQALLKNAIDNVNAAQSELDVSNRTFDEDLYSIQQSLRKYYASSKQKSDSSSNLSASAASSSRINIPSPSLIPELLHSLESHAQEMADLLTSLVQHYDLCVTAIKHTEGGGPAIQNIIRDLPAAFGSDTHNETEPNRGDEDDDMPLVPLTDSEHQDMVSVVTKDSQQVEDVVLEVQDLIEDMESTLDRVLEQQNSVVQVCKSTTDIFHRLNQFASKNLPDYIAQSRSFAQTWNKERERMKSGMADLSDLRGLYVGFLDAYDGLILEVARRKSARSAVEKVLSDARKKLDKLYDEDVRAREAFRVDQGDYLPSDIWPGLSSAPMKIEFKRIFDGKLYDDGGEQRGQPRQEEQRSIGHEGDEDSSNHGSNNNHIEDNFEDRIPDLPRNVVEKAYSRLSARAKNLGQG